MTEPRFQVGEPVEKFTGDYTGPGTVEDAMVLADGRIRYIVSHKIEGGAGTFLHIYSEQQLRRPE